MKLTLILFAICAASAYAETLDLSGQWAFELDRENAGVYKGWYKRPLSEDITLPGSLQEQGFGDTPNAQTEWTSGIGMGLLKDSRFAKYINGKDFQCPFWLTPERHYAGAAWYQREFTAPEEWAGQRIVLVLERPHWQTTVWVDEEKVGVQDSLAVAHTYDLTKWIKPGKSQRLTIRVDNTYIIPVGKDAHSISDQTQSNWNGITGAIQLISEPKIWFEDVQINPDVSGKRIHVSITLGNGEGTAGRGNLTLEAGSCSNRSNQKIAPKQYPIEWNEEGGSYQFDYDMGENCELWSEYNPALYRLHVELNGGGVKASREVSFGMRQIGIQDKQFTINGHKIFLRGTLECCIFPQHGYPPTDVNEWKRIIGIAKSYGLNHFRFHSWCPPEAAFQAADEMGFYFQVEACCWAAFGDDTPVDEWIYQECGRILKAYGNHPSFLFLSPTNEPSGKNCDAFLGKLVEWMKAKDARHFYTAGTGWPQVPENQYHIQYATRLQNWKTLKFDQPPQTWDDYREYVDKLDAPTVSHEVGQWCVYPDLNEDRLYTGSLKAKNIAIFRDKLQKAGMGQQSRDFLFASGKFQTLLYKQEIEAALRTPGFAGFQLLDLHDFPGQGTAPVGVLNAFWQSKGYVSSQQYRRFCNDVTPLARMKKRIFTNDESLEAAIDIANYSMTDLENVTVAYRIGRESGQILFDGEFANQTIAAGGLTRIATLKQPLQSIAKAAQLNLDVEISGYPYGNDWDLWVYPNDLNTDEPSGVSILDDWKAAWDELQAGRTVLLVPDTAAIASDTLGTFRPIFWNRITFPSQVEHTLGILCDNVHPALADFPSDIHSHWQWQDLLDRSKPIAMDDLPQEIQAIVQPIDDWNNCRKLGVLFEAQIKQENHTGQGRLMVCSIDILHDLDTRPAARQLRYSLLNYMSSDRFNPSSMLTNEQYKSLFKEPPLLQRVGATAFTDSYQNGFEGEKAIDGNPNTIWHSRWEPQVDPFPHTLTIDLKKPVEIRGVAVLPRQDMSNGRIARYEINVSADGETWQTAASGMWANDSTWKTIRFENSYSIRYVRLTALNEVNGNSFVSVAEAGVLSE